MSVGTGATQSAEYHGLTFEYNDKYPFEKDEEKDNIRITYEPKKVLANISFVEKTDDELDIEAYHLLFLNNMGNLQNVQTSNLEVGGVTGKATTAILDSQISTMVATVPTEEGFVYFLLMVNTGAEIGADDFIQMINSINVG